MKVLIADDELPARARLREMLSEISDCEVVGEAGHGHEVLRMCEEFSPDVVLLDIRMPKKSGFEIYNEIRQFRKIPVLFVTAYPKSFTGKSNEVVKMWQNEFSDGTTDIIYKPFSLTTLFEKVEGLIGKADDAGED